MELLLIISHIFPVICDYVGLYPSYFFCDLSNLLQSNLCYAVFKTWEESYTTMK